MNIHSFESLAALDGEGLRYAIFLTGCPLRCVYCHNPDTWATSGTEYSCEALLKKLLRYRPYFGENGGVTFSGGEPLLQAAQIKEIAPLLKENGIGYTLDTCGAVPLSEDVKAALKGAELVICDLKFPDKESFKQYTGGDFSLVIDFLKYLDKINKKVWIRTVIVPDINDDEKSVTEYVRVVSKFKNVVKYELLAFHTMGFFKYENLGINNPLAGTKPLSSEKLKALQAYVDKFLKAE